MPSTTQNHKHKSLRILVVESSSPDLDAIMASFSAKGIEAVGVKDGEAALDLLSSEAFDAVLTDLMLPGKSGLDFARRVRDKFPGVATILMSAFPVPRMQLARCDCGAVGCVPKPVDVDRLTGFVADKVLGSKPTQASSPWSQAASAPLNPFEIPVLRFA